MQTKKPSPIFYLAVILLLIVLGFFRDYFVKNYNMYLYQVYYKDMSYYVAPEFSFLQHFSYLQLYYGKFLLAAAFCLIYFLIALLVIHTEFRNRKFIQISVYFHLAVVVTILIFYFYGTWMKGGERVEEVSRAFLALLQSPLLLMVLYPAFKLNAKLNQ